MEWSYGGLPYQKIVDMTEYTTTGLTLASLPTFTRNTVNTLRFNMPKDAFSVKNWAGTSPPDNRVGLHPTETGCTKGGGGSGGLTGPTTTGAVYTGDGHSLHRNGSLTFQLIKASTPDSAIQLASAKGDPAFGYRVKVGDRKSFLLAEWTVFWHNKVTSCYGLATWHKNPGPDTSPPGNVVAPTPGTLDPPWGDLGKVVNVSTKVVDDPNQSDAKFTIRITETTYSTGTKVIKEEYMEGTKVKKTVITIIPPAAGRPALGSGKRRNLPGAGRVQHPDGLPADAQFRQAGAGELARTVHAVTKGKRGHPPPFFKQDQGGISIAWAITLAVTVPVALTRSHSSMRRTRAGRGFTLIELMIAMAVIGILTAIAWPSYQNYIIRSSRQAAQTELLQLANQQEKIYLNANSYAVSITGAYNGRADGGLGKATGRTDDGKYNLTITPNATPTQTFLITATPVVGSTQDGDGAITISSDGTRLHGGAAW